MRLFSFIWQNYKSARFVSNENHLNRMIVQYAQNYATNL